MKNKYTVPECLLCVIDAGDVMLIRSAELDVADFNEDEEISVSEHFNFS